MNDPRQQVPDALDTRLTRALETPPPIAIPADFAARVARQLPARQVPARKAPSPVWRSTLPPASVGRRMGYGAIFFLAFLMLALIPSLRAIGGPARSSVESLLCLEFVALTLWISVGPQRQR